MQKIKVSYLVALYNKEDFIEECINSILEENSEDIEMEVCVVDDGSNDRSLEIVQSKYALNPHVKIANFHSNRGKNAAYNKAFLMSTGEYICVFGADDILVPLRTKRLLELSKKYNKSVYGDLIRLDNSVESVNDIQEYLNVCYKNSCYRELDFYNNIMQNTLGGGCSFIKKDHANIIFPIPENLKFEDWWISYNLLKNDWVVGFSDIVTIYRIHNTNDSVILGNKHAARIRDYLRHFDYLDEFSKIATSCKEKDTIKKSRVLREVYLSKCEIKDFIKYLSIDKYSIKILLLYFLGAKNVSNIKDFLDKKLK